MKQDVCFFRGIRHRRIVKVKLLVLCLTALFLSACVRSDINEDISGISVVIDVDTEPVKINPFIYGQFIEHIENCIYDGIWAEMLTDRKFFYAVGADESPWELIADSAVIMDDQYPFVGEHTPILKGKMAHEKLVVEQDRGYTGYIWLKPTETTQKVCVTLRSGGEDETVEIECIQADYAKYAFNFQGKSDDENGSFCIESLYPVYVGTASLMPADNIDGMRADTIEILKDLGGTIYRWPGGNFVSGYDWEDGIGDRDHRPPRRNLAWSPDPSLDLINIEAKTMAGVIEPNDFGTDEFLKFCELINTEPYIVVNAGLALATDAKNWVEYVNGSTDTQYGQLRAENGHVEPYGVVYWGVGNEMYGDWQLGHIPLDEYVKRHNEIAYAMREVSPEIKLVAVGNLGDWTKTMLMECTDMDYISQHFYPALGINAEEQIDISRKEYDVVLGKLRGLLNEAGKAENIKLALDEYAHANASLPSSLKNGIGVAAALNAMFRNADIIGMAEYSSTVNVTQGCVVTNHTKVFYEAAGLVLKMYRHSMQDYFIPVSCQNASIDVCAAISEDKKTVTLAVANPTYAEIILCPDLDGFQLVGAEVITADDEEVVNTEENPQAITIKSLNTADGVKSPAISVALFTFEKRGEEQ